MIFAIKNMGILSLEDFIFNLEYRGIKFKPLKLIRSTLDLTC
jgi:hypothetical protein